MKKFPANEKGFLGLIEMLAVLGVICFLAYFLINNYLKPHVLLEAEDPGGNDQPAHAPISYSSVLSKTKEKVEQINERTKDRYQQFDELNR